MTKNDKNCHQDKGQVCNTTDNYSWCNIVNNTKSCFSQDGKNCFNLNQGFCLTFDGNLCNN